MGRKPKATPHKLHARLRAAMRERGINQEELARMLVLSETAVSRRMCARQPWSVDEAHFIMDKLGIDHRLMHLYFPRDGVETDEDALGIEDYLRSADKSLIDNTQLNILRTIVEGI